MRQRGVEKIKIKISSNVFTVAGMKATIQTLTTKWDNYEVNCNT